MKINCLDVIRELSNYLDRDVDEQLRIDIETHLPTCAHCTAIFDGLRNMVRLTGDGRAFELPIGFSQRLRRRIRLQSR